MNGGDWARYRVDMFNRSGQRVGVHRFADRGEALEYGDDLLEAGRVGFEVVDCDAAGRPVIHYGRLLEGGRL